MHFITSYPWSILSQSHKVKQAQVEYNSEIQLKTIPHYDGVHRSFEDTLKEHIYKLVWPIIIWALLGLKFVNIAIDGR